MRASEGKNKIYRFKIVCVGFVFVLFFAAIILRSYHLQILGNSKLNTLAQSQYKKKIIISPKRGTVYDRHGDVLALDILVSSVGIHPHRIENTKEVKDVLHQTTGVSYSVLDKKFKSKRRFEWVRRRIPGEAGKQLEKMRISGSQVVSEYRRFYPNKELAGQVLGAVGYDAKALGGIESKYNKYLMSASHRQSVERDARGKSFSKVEDSDQYHDLYLTLDKNIQYIAESVLLEFAEKNKVESGFALVTDADNGEILALANYPSFNPNLYWKYDQSVWRNHAIADEYEPGSTFKPISVIGALNSGKVKLADKFYCEGGRYRIGSATINDHGRYGWMPVADILKVSSNIGATKIAMQAGREAIYKTIKEMGFGELTGLGLVGEGPGSVRPYKSWRNIEFSNISFGQGLSVNGAQMAMAYGSIVNGGLFYKPSLVAKIVDSQGDIVLQNDPKPLRRVMKKGLSEELIKVLHSVTQAGGTAKQAHVAGYLSGGKTGTAQKFDLKTKSYAAHDYISSFIGFVPLDKPRYVIYVVYDTPRQNGHYGGVIAGPAFKAIAEKTLSYAGVVPPIVKDDEMLKVAVKKARIGAQKKKEESANEEILTKDIREIYRLRQKNIQESMAQKVVPDLTGMSLRDVLTLMQNHKLKFDIKGSGYVVRQSPQAGAVLNDRHEWKIILDSRS